MKNKTLYFIEPDLNDNNLRIVGDFFREHGISMSFEDSEIFLMENVKELIYKRGITSLLSMQLLTEAVLPDNSSKNKIIEILKHKLSQIIPSHSLLVIDPYLFPTKADIDYETFFMSIFQDTLKTCRVLDIVTQKDRNQLIETRIIMSIKNLNPSIFITTKYSKVFHDRFWIADETKGLFVGSSLNGVGKRYAVIDNLKNEDVKEIVGRYKIIA